MTSTMEQVNATLKDYDLMLACDNHPISDQKLLEYFYEKGKTIAAFPILDLFFALKLSAPRRMLEMKNKFEKEGKV